MCLKLKPLVFNNYIRFYRLMRIRSKTVKVFTGTVVNWALPSLILGSFEMTLPGGLTNDGF